MARRGKITFGHKRLRNALRAWGDDVVEQAKQLVVDTAIIIQSNAQALAPVDDGNLRDSIEMIIAPDGLSAEIRVTAEYAIYVEYGTGIYAVGGDGRKTPWTYYSTKLNQFVTTRGMRAQPFWYPAIVSGGQHFKREIRRLGG